MSDRQELARCQSVPVLNREDAVFKKVQDQDGLISLIQTQIEFQNETITKHERKFEDLLSKVQSLTGKVQELENELSKRASNDPLDVQRTAVWSTNNESHEKKISIADMVKETAEKTLGTETSYIYDEKLGLYFDQTSGFYYDPVKQLFYNGHTRTYYSYDSATNTYNQVYSNESIKRKNDRKNKKKTKQKKILESCSTTNMIIPPDINDNSNSLETLDTATCSNPASPMKPGSDMEEGEISSSSATSLVGESSPRSATNEGETDSSDDCTVKADNQQSYPPCIRAVIQLPNSSALKKGTLFLVPYTGGTVGSKGTQHAILLPSPSVEKVHAKIYYQSFPSSEETEQDEGKYFITDLGSKEGTYLNKLRLSDSGVPSEPHEVVHGSILQIGDVTLLLHIHPGDFRCGHCEPGLIIKKDPMYEYTGETSDNVRKSEMKKLKKKYGLDRKNANVPTVVAETGYVDRAGKRRLKVGSDNPFAKTEVASTAMPLSGTNKGFKMLQKMGWKGEGLGNPQNEGIKEPIDCQIKFDRAGLGMQSSQLPTGSTLSSNSERKNKRPEKLAKTIERFNELRPSSGDHPEEGSHLDY